MVFCDVVFASTNALRENLALKTVERLGRDYDGRLYWEIFKERPGPVRNLPRGFPEFGRLRLTHPDE